MRSRSRLASGIAAAALLLAACASNTSTSSGSGGSSASTSSQDVCASASGDGPKIGLAYDVGGRGDQSFNDSAYAGLTKVVQDLHGSCKESEAQTGESDADREERLRTLADAGYNPIVAVGFIYSPAVDVVAKESAYKDINFAVVDGFASAPNAANLTFAANQGSFLVGVAAALKTKANHVGFLGGVNGPLIQAFQAGYVAGVKAVDPSIKVDVVYLSQDDNQQGFENPSGGKTAATGMYDNGADIIYHAAGKSGLGLFQAAAAAGDGHWAIGVDSDQYLTASPDEKPHILTSMLKRVDVGVYDYVKAFADGQPQTGTVTFDLKSGGVDYATSGGFIDDITSKIDAYKQKIIDGQIKVPTKP